MSAAICSKLCLTFAPLRKPREHSRCLLFTDIGFVFRFDGHSMHPRVARRVQVETSTGHEQRMGTPTIMRTDA